VEELRKGVLFYSWTHGSTLSESPERVAEITRERVRTLREIEDFAGTLAEWRSRTGPVDRIHVGRDDYALDRNIFFYCLASLQRPALAEDLLLRVTRTAPDGSETTDLITQAVAQVNRTAQSAGILYSMAGLAPGEHRLHVEVLDGEEVAASGDLWVDYQPGDVGTS
jgi:hypothetical protein